MMGARVEAGLTLGQCAGQVTLELKPEEEEPGTGIG